jgi:Glycosyltransferase
MELIKKQIKDNIQIYISNNELDKAMTLIEELLTIDLNDIEIYSMKAVALIMQGSMNEAENVLKQGLLIDKCNFDLNYNLGYLYEQTNRFNEALKYYNISLKNCEDENVKVDITACMEKISSKLDISQVEDDENKIAFFVKEGMDSFLDDIIEGVSDEFEIRKIIVTDLNQIQEGMEWADICWFEWCDELVAYGSSHSLASSKMIVCRLHSYEAFTEYPANVKWENVDKIIFVGKNIRDFVIDVYKLDENKAVIIPNGIDINKYNFIEREPGFNIAYVGYVNYKKGPMLLLHTFKSMYDKDNRYKLHIAGKFQEGRDLLYFNQMINEFGIGNNVFFDGWQDDLDKWLEDKNYILCTSILESQNLSVMQAMCKGIKPIIHNFVGAKAIYDEKYVWNTIDDAIEILINNTYNSKEYLEFIQNNYSIEKELSSVKQILRNKISEKNDFNYRDYWNNRLNNKFDIEGVGYIGLGQIYNEFLYKSRFEILSYIIDKLFGQIKNKSVLELGPGIGLFTDYFCKNNVDKYYAIDISEKSQKELSEKFEAFKFTLGDIAEKENYPKDKYDFVFAADVLLHLTDEEKYKNVIKNLSDVLKDDGYIVLFDPITTIDSKSMSPHLVIRDIRYIKEILKENELEVIGVMPSAFFMNYPFDKDIIKEKADKAQNIFDLIQVAFGSTQLTDVTKKDLANWLSLLDKQCIVNNKFGLSQKVIVIKKKDNNRLIDFNIEEVWNYNDIKTHLVNNETRLNENDEIKKYDLITIFRENANVLMDFKL